MDVSKVEVEAKDNWSIIFSNVALHLTCSPIFACTARGERRRTSSMFMRPSVQEGPDPQKHLFTQVASFERQKPAAPALTSSEAQLLAAKMQKVFEVAIKGVEVWFVVRSTEEGESALQFFSEGEPTDGITAASIASIKSRRRVRVKDPFLFS